MKISYILMSLCLLILSDTAISEEQCHGTPTACKENNTKATCHGHQITYGVYHNCRWDNVNKHCATKKARCKL